MQLFINAADEVPIYRQIMRQVIEAIAGGRLHAGERLLSHRELSERLAIAPLTVKKAYDELEAQGYITSHRGSGTYVADEPPRLARSVHAEQVNAAARALLSRAYLAGMDFDGVIAVLKSADRELANGPSQRQPRKRPA